MAKADSASNLPRATHLVYHGGRWKLCRRAERAAFSQGAEGSDVWCTPAGARICSVGEEDYAEPLPSSSRRTQAEAGPEGRWRVTGLPGLRQLVLRASQWRARRGSGEATVLATARVHAVGPLADGAVVVVYADHLGQGDLHVQLYDEFHDGRWERTE